MHSCFLFNFSSALPILFFKCTGSLLLFDAVLLSWVFSSGTIFLAIMTVSTGQTSLLTIFQVYTLIELIIFCSSDLAL